MADALERRAHAKTVHYRPVSYHLPKRSPRKRDAVNGLLVQGLDPNEQYRSEQEQQDEETNLSFRVVAQEWYEKRTVTQTESTRRLKMQRLERHVFPSFGDLPIKQLKPRDIILVLHAIESQGRREMARRVGQIIGQICRYARVVGYLEYDISSGITKALEPRETARQASLVRSYSRNAKRLHGDVQVATG